MAEKSRVIAIAAVALFIILIPISLQPIYSYDFFWHLATGRWIAEHHALPLTDPFAIASDRTSWINGEWLFQLLLYGAYAIGGIAAVAWQRAALVAVIFAGGFWFSGR